MARPTILSMSNSPDLTLFTLSNYGNDRRQGNLEPVQTEFLDDICISLGFCSVKGIYQVDNSSVTMLF